MSEEIPVKIGDTLKLGVIKFGKQGTPIMIYKEFVIFLKNKKEIRLNEIIKIKIVKVCKKYAFAELI